LYANPLTQELMEELSTVDKIWRNIINRLHLTDPAAADQLLSAYNVDRSVDILYSSTIARLIATTEMLDLEISIRPKPKI
jgi:hypothetical protein